MKTNLQNTIIRASAGTGKTYQLANRYIALLLLQGVSEGRISPDRIVAMTFTRKGAGEFAHRILQRLAAAAGDTKERSVLQRDLAIVLAGDPEHGVVGLAPGVEVSVDAATVQTALVAMIDQFDRLVLGTIDGFMARSVQTLAFELGLGGFEILEASASKRERGVLLGEVFASVTTENLEVFHQTLKLATLKSDCSLSNALDDIIPAYHALLHGISCPDAWGGAAFWAGTVPVPGHPNWRDESKELLLHIHEAPPDNKEVVNGLVKALTWLGERSVGSSGDKLPTWLDAKGQLGRIFDRWPKVWECFPRSNSKRPCIVPASIMAPLRPILAAWIAAESQALALKTVAIHGIVARYEALYDLRDRRKGRLAFSDLPLLLDEGEGAEARREALRLLSFRWYQGFDHWLLDEFQDTSRLQWGVLGAWLDEALQDDSGTKSVFVVGDAKQSIYGWRGGEPRLFGELAGRYSVGTFQEQIMAESWRSRPSVLELVNRVCDPALNPALTDPDLFSPGAKERWLYDTHRSAKARQEQGGYATVLLVAPEKENEGGEPETTPEDDGPTDDRLSAQSAAIKAALEKVKPLERGLSCAILVRKGSNAKTVAQWLRAHGVPQVMVEGDVTLAEQAPVVAAIVDALRWLATPAHSLGIGHIRLTPLWKALAQFAEGEDGIEPSLGVVWSHWRNRIAEIGAPQVTHEWCIVLAAAQGEQSYARYCLNVVSAAALQAGSGLTLPDWLDSLAQLTVRETAAAGSIHVMTIHKAKGLGFDVVFLPDLDRGGGGANDVLLRRDAHGVTAGCLSAPPKWLQAWNPVLGKLGSEQLAEQDLEALCVLYVALTRAKEATFVILNEEKPKRASRAREWLLGALPKSEEGDSEPSMSSPWGSGKLLWECGSPEIYGGRSPELPEQRTELSLTPPSPRPKRRKPSETSHGPDLAGPVLSSANRGMEFGTAVHKVFEQIGWWEPSRVLVGDDAAVALVRSCLDRPSVQALFTAGSNQDEALREIPVEFVERDTWWSGVIDRLVLRRNADGSLHEATVIDFKTDRVESGSVLSQRYAGQLGVYRRAISSALGLREEQVKVVLLSTCLEEVVTL